MAEKWCSQNCYQHCHRWDLAHLQAVRPIDKNRLFCTSTALHKQILMKLNKFTAQLLILPLTTTNVLLKPGFLGYGALSLGECCLMFQGILRPSKCWEKRTQWHSLTSQETPILSIEAVRTLKISQTNT
jgi:hypothetical protein